MRAADAKNETLSIMTILENPNLIKMNPPSGGAPNRASPQIRRGTDCATNMAPVASVEPVA